MRIYSTPPLLPAVSSVETRTSTWIRTARWSLVSLLLLLAGGGNASGQTDPEQWLMEAEAAYANVTSYTAVLHKQQRVEGVLRPEETIALKFTKPFGLYMCWIAAPHKGSEVLYVDGWNRNLARVHAGGWLRHITLNLAPTNQRLMADNLRPLTETGIGGLVNIVAINVRKAIQAGELGFFERGHESVYGRRTRIVELVFPHDRAGQYDAARALINQDDSSKMLVRIQVFDRDNLLCERYGYEHLDLDAGLLAEDFDPANPDYRFL